VLGTEGLRSRFESAGATFLRYKYAPDNDLRQPETDLVKDWQTRNPLSQWQRVRDRQLCGPAREFCRDVAEELQPSFCRWPSGRRFWPCPACSSCYLLLLMVVREAWFRRPGWNVWW
jgi:hypothetical protein